MAEQNKPAAAGQAKKLGTIGLAAIVISSMVGGGVFSLPQNMAAGASAGAVLLAWLITGIGIYFIANTFSILSRVKPDLTAGIYMYARDGFGPYAGFTVGWGYWLCQHLVEDCQPENIYQHHRLCPQPFEEAPGKVHSKPSQQIL